MASTDTELVVRSLQSIKRWFAVLVGLVALAIFTFDPIAHDLPALVALSLLGLVVFCPVYVIASLSGLFDPLTARRVREQRDTSGSD